MFCQQWKHSAVCHLSVTQAKRDVMIQWSDLCAFTAVMTFDCFHVSSVVSPLLPFSCWSQQGYAFRSNSPRNTKKWWGNLALRGFLETLFSLQQSTDIAGALLEWPRDWMMVGDMTICSKSIILLEEKKHSYSVMKNWFLSSLPVGLKLKHKVEEHGQEKRHQAKHESTVLMANFHVMWSCQRKSVSESSKSTIQRWCNFDLGDVTTVIFAFKPNRCHRSKEVAIRANGSLYTKP